MQKNEGTTWYCKFMIHQLCRSLCGALSQRPPLDGVSVQEISKESRSMSVLRRSDIVEEKEYHTASDSASALCCQGRDWSDNGQASRQAVAMHPEMRWSNLIIISGGVPPHEKRLHDHRLKQQQQNQHHFMQYHRAIVGRRRVETCNPPDQPVPFIPSSLYYQYSVAWSGAEPLCDYEETEMLKPRWWWTRWFAASAQLNGDWEESADCRSNAEGNLFESLSRIWSDAQINSRLVIISNFPFPFGDSWLRAELQSLMLILPAALSKGRRRQTFWWMIINFAAIYIT